MLLVLVRTCFTLRTKKKHCEVVGEVRMCHISALHQKIYFCLTLLAFSTVSYCRNLKFFSSTLGIQNVLQIGQYISVVVHLCVVILQCYLSVLSISMATRGQPELYAELGVRCIITKLQNVMLPVGMLDGTYGIFKTFQPGKK